MEWIKFVEWGIAGLFTFGGAFYGCSLSDRLTRQTKEGETAARRAHLLEALRIEVHLAATQIEQVIQSGKPETIFRIRLYAMDALLDGNTLEYTKDAALIDALISVRSGLDSINDFISLQHLTRVIPGKQPPEAQDTARKVAARIASLLETLDGLISNPKLGDLDRLYKPNKPPS